ncbi:hypothetical protein H3H37_20570 [Duganella sp. LX20W]|uniref:Uncharacterized protein n=1 Tax=Rugamonas brunnea TaxID=2758569 RepID=A0A7W2IDD2_9BURK|nr:hypothetical protein [Rugamonas brunnea]MBA5639461.1 hypothetical protein [Rugamonas brunnea]
MSDLDLRLAALSKLVDIKSAAVDSRLSDEFKRISEILQKSTEYNALSESLKILAVLVPRFHMATLPTLTSFVRTISNRGLTEEGKPLSETQVRYWTHESLIREAIDVAEKIRYVHTEDVIDFLLEMSQSAEEEVRAKAERSLESLAAYHLDIFFSTPPRGAEPQARLVTHLSKLKDDALLRNANVILRVLSKVLSPTIEGTSWSYQTITIRRGSVTSDGGVAAVRSDAINLAKRMYGLDKSIEHRKQVLHTLDSATRRERSDSDAETLAMFERDTIAVLEFMHDQVATDALPLVQSIEHMAYWDYFHGATQTIKEKALQIRDALAAHKEYQIYKQLIGFEGIFGNWEDLSRSEEAWGYSDAKRKEAARRYLDEIDDSSFDLWKNRILEFSKTRSNDMAMFPVYYEFLESIGKEKPQLALNLITVHEEVMAYFLIPLIRGLWANVHQPEIEGIVREWISAGRNLTTIAKSLYNVGVSKLDVLTAVLTRASEIDDRETLMQIMGVAANLYSEGANDAMPIFMQALRELAKKNDTRWVSVIWFRKDFNALIRAMASDDRTELLTSLIPLPNLDYHGEEILSEIAQQDLKGVIDFFIERIKYARSLEKSKKESDDFGEDRYEPVPYQLHKLNGLLSAEPGQLLAALRRDFEDEVQYMFSYRGARLIKSAFPAFGSPIEELLLDYTRAGSQDDIDFVIGVLRTYEGSLSTYEVCKAIVKTVPEHSTVWNEVAAIIESTGVVHGEYGMVHSFESKQQALSTWLTEENEHVRAFAEWLSDGLRRFIENERQRVDEGLALRKYRFGIDKDET